MKKLLRNFTLGLTLFTGAFGQQPAYQPTAATSTITVEKPSPIPMTPSEPEAAQPAAPKPQKAAYPDPYAADKQAVRECEQELFELERAYANSLARTHSCDEGLQKQNIRISEVARSCDQRKIGYVDKRQSAVSSAADEQAKWLADEQAALEQAKQDRAAFQRELEELRGRPELLPQTEAADEARQLIRRRGCRLKKMGRRRAVGFSYCARADSCRRSSRGCGRDG